MPMMTDRLLAALMFFTRLPFGRIWRVDAECFRHVVDYWPFAGWLTGGMLAVVLLLAQGVLPAFVAALLAVGMRLLLTGALHEDGLADCCDGFGGGRDRRQVLAIMKDSRIGTYGVLGLLFHTALLVSLMSLLPEGEAPALVFTADIYAKACASFILLQLPYARTAEQAKAGVVYAGWQGRRILWHAARCLCALLPALAWLWHTADAFPYWAFLAPPVVEGLTVRYLRHRLQGYTGDCCGAVFLLCELGFYLTFVILYTY